METELLGAGDIRQVEAVAVVPSAVRAVEIERGTIVLLVLFLQETKVQIGDTILFSSYAGTEVKKENEDAEYLILSEDDILGILV